MNAAVTALPEPVYVYVIGAEGGPQKIGVAGDPRRRLGLLQTGNPAGLVISATIEVTCVEARAIETYAHHLLREQRVRGEWFDVAPDVAAGAVRQAVLDVRAGKRIEGQDIAPAQLRAARALVDWSRDQLAEAAQTTVRTLARIEAGETVPRGRTLAAIRAALEGAGVVFIDPNGGGPGVRLAQSVWQQAA